MVGGVGEGGGWTPSPGASSKLQLPIRRCPCTSVSCLTALFSLVHCYTTVETALGLTHPVC